MRARFTARHATSGRGTRRCHAEIVVDCSRGRHYRRRRGRPTGAVVVAYAAAATSCSTAPRDARASSRVRNGLLLAGARDAISRREHARVRVPTPAPRRRTRSRLADACADALARHCTRTCADVADVVLAIDAGTTGVRTVAVDADGRARRASRTASSRSTSPARAGSSTTPTRSGARCTDTLAEVVAALDGDDRRRRSASPTSARRSWCGTAAPAGPVTGRSCGRTAAPRRAATSCAPPAYEPLVRERTGLVLDPYFSATKLEWLLARGRRRRRRRPRVRHRRLVGAVEPHRRCTRPSRRTRAARCSSTSTRATWSDELLELFGVPRSCLPEVLPSSGRFGIDRPGARRRARGAGVRASPATSRPRCSARRASRPA